MKLFYSSAPVAARSALAAAVAAFALAGCANYAGIKSDKELDDLWSYLKQFAADGQKK